MLQAWRHNHPKNVTNLELGKALVVCGYFDRSVLKEVQDIFTKEDYKQGLAEVLYMLGEKNQYHNDIGETRYPLFISHINTFIMML